MAQAIAYDGKAPEWPLTFFTSGILRPPLR
jgi:hypothetical protein